MPTNEQLEQLKLALEAEESLSKSQLQELLEISSKNTLRDSLKACGLETKQERYTAEEIWEQFIPARQMVEAGSTYKDVAEHFGLKDSEGEEVEVDYAAEEQYQDAGMTDGMDINVAEGMVASVEDSVERIAFYVPKLVVNTIKQKLNSEQMRTAITQEMKNQLEIDRQQKSTSAGADFLLRKMNNNAKQLTGSSNPQALPEASEENSNE